MSTTTITTLKKIPTIDKVKEMINDNLITSNWVNNISFDNVYVASSISNVYGICYGNDKYIIYGINILLYSLDCKIWNSISIDNTTIIRLFYGNNKFVGYQFKNNIGTFIYSDDGINWTETKISDSPSNCYISYGNGIYIAILDNSNIYKSTDGIEWIIQSYKPENTIRAFCFGNNLFIAISKTNIYYSNNGETWNVLTTDNTNMRAITYGNNKFIIYDNSTAEILASNDGLTWNNSYDTNLPAGYALSNCPLTYNSDVFFITYQSCLFYSEDLINWYELEINNSDSIRSICFGNNKCAIVSLYESYYCVHISNQITLYKYVPINYIQNIKSEIINQIYPIGSIYMSTNNNQPNIFIGGTWETITSPITDSYAWKRTE